MSGNAPERIWAWQWEVNPRMGQWEAKPSIVGEGHPYIIATPEALAASPEVQALIRDAVAAEREACAKVAWDEDAANQAYSIKVYSIFARNIAAAIRARGGE